MSEVKRYDISAFGGMSMDECTDGAYVSYEDYAELEAKCAALAAENAWLNDKMNKLLVWPGIEFYSSAWEFCNLDGNDALEFMCDKETPATDAFLTEVRAQGVDSAINTVIAMMNHQHPVTSKAIDIMRVHAYQIRKGVQS